MVVTFKNQGKIGPSFMYTLCIGSISPTPVVLTNAEVWGLQSTYHFLVPLAFFVLSSPSLAS